MMGQRARRVFAVRVAILVKFIHVNDFSRLANDGDALHSGNRLFRGEACTSSQLNRKDVHPCYIILSTTQAGPAVMYMPRWVLIMNVEHVPKYVVFAVFEQGVVRTRRGDYLRH